MVRVVAYFAKCSDKWDNDEGQFRYKISLQQ